MAVVAVYIEKQTTWRGDPEPFGNTYHFAVDDLAALNDQALINYVAGVEDNVHGSSVQFLRGRTWGPTDQGEAASIIREEIPLSLSGALSGAAIFREAAIICGWELPRAPGTNRRRWLRKFLRIGQLPSGYPTTVATGGDELGSSLRGFFQTQYVDQIKQPTAVGTGCNLSTRSGVVPGGNGSVRNYLGTRRIEKRR